jgi:hypothetical protein
MHLTWSPVPQVLNRLVREMACPRAGAMCV